MSALKISVFGASNSGKTQLVRALLEQPFNENYTSSEHPIFYRIMDTQELWDIPNQYKSFHNLFNSNPDVILYCIDVSQDIENGQKIAEELQKLNQDCNSILIIIGTKSDLVEAPLCEERLNGIKSYFKLPHLAEIKTIITSAKQTQDTGLMNVTELLKNLSSDKNEQEQEQEQVIDLGDLSKISSIKTTKYPNSYDQMWRRGQDLTTQATEVDYYSALTILKDYCKITSFNSSSIFSSIKLFFTGHIRRHHTDTIRNFLHFSYNGTTSIDKLLNELNDALITAAETINPNGSLAKRINFIQKQANLSIINIEDINDKIIHNRSKPIIPIDEEDFSGENRETNNI